MAKKIKWLDEPEDHNYPAAESYLSLLFSKGPVTAMVNNLRKAPIVSFKSKDIFRASKLSLLGISNTHMRRDKKKIKKGKKLSPILLIRDKNGGLIVADGYHRLCAVYYFNEDVEIPCKIS